MAAKAEKPRTGTAGSGLRETIIVIIDALLIALVFRTAEARFLSLKDDIPIWQIWRWWDHLRLDRMFRSVYW